MADKEVPPKGPSSTCPECGTEMIITRVKPLLFGENLKISRLRCKACGFTKEIRIWRS